MSLFKNKYRIESTRLQGWDYSSNGCYFVTICIRNRICFFGDVVAGEMQLSKSGELAKSILTQIPNYFPNFQLNEFVVMPNHIHTILIIDNNQTVKSPKDETTQNLINPLSTNSNSRGGVTGRHNPMLSQDSLSKVIRWYKGRSKFEIGKINSAFSWQRGLHESILRDEESLNRVRNYIVNNPLTWQDDKENPVNVLPQSKLKPK